MLVTLNFSQDMRKSKRERERERGGERTLEGRQIRDNRPRQIRSSKQTRILGNVFQLLGLHIQALNSRPSTFN